MTKMHNGMTGQPVVMLPSLREVIEVDFVCRIGCALEALGVSRRRMVDWLADTLYGYEGVVLDDTGAVFAHWDVDLDALFCDDEARAFHPDPAQRVKYGSEGRWFSDIRLFARQRPRQRAQGRVAPRLQAVALALMIAGVDSFAPTER